MRIAIGICLTVVLRSFFIFYLCTHAYTHTLSYVSLCRKFYLKKKEGKEEKTDRFMPFVVTNELIWFFVVSCICLSAFVRWIKRKKETKKKRIEIQKINS